MWLVLGVFKMVGISTGVSLLSSGGISWQGTLEYTNVNTSYSVSGVGSTSISFELQYDTGEVVISKYDSLGTIDTEFGSWFTVLGSDPSSFLGVYFESRFTVLSGSGSFLGHIGWKQMSILDFSSTPFFQVTRSTAGINTCQIRVEIREISDPSNISTIDITFNVTSV